MKKKITEKIILKAGAALLSFGMLWGTLVYAFPMQVSAADEIHDHALDATPENGSIEEGGEVFDQYVTPENVYGKLFMGTDALRDPVAVSFRQNGVSGTYYAPQTYVYFGEAYSNSEERMVPILLRVLDADKDNAGNTGAMFVMTEQASSTDTVFFQYKKQYDEVFYGTFAIDNVYDLSAPYRLMGYFATDNYQGNYKNHFANLPEELDYIRAVTVTDKLSELDGLYGYGQEYNFTWEVDRRKNGTLGDAEKLEQTTFINGQQFFLLSAYEMSKYVSSVPGAPGMATTKFGTNDPVVYWLRTGLDYSNPSAENGDNVGAVDENGNVVPYDAGNYAYVRYGFNIETEDIQFMYEITPGAYRLTFLDPTYKAAIEHADPDNGIDKRFKASLVDIKDGVLTVEFSNALYNKSNNQYSDVDENIGISVMVKGSDGNVKYYGKVEDRIYGLSTPSSISSEKGEVKFRLPEDFDYDNDELYVFWEMTQTNAESATFISNMVKIECLHADATAATCMKPASCPDCGDFGKRNPDNHEGLDTSVYYTDKASGTHWNVCSDCGMKANVEKCTFGDDCSFRCVCGNTDYSPEKHIYDENGICTVDRTHFEAPTIEYNHGARHIVVRIHNEGQLIAFSEMHNSGEFDEDYDFSVFLESDLDFSGIQGFEPIGTEERPFDGYLSGKNYTVSNLTVDTDEKYAGIFGYAEQADVRYLNLNNCSVQGTDYAGLLVGKVVKSGNETVRFDTVNFVDCRVNATSDAGKEGILLGEACNGIYVYKVYTEGVKNSDGAFVRFFSNPESFEDITVERSVCLYTESGDFGERDEAAFASGEVAHIMGKGQRIGEDAKPSTDTPSINDGTRVFKVTDCSGELLRYTNEYISIHHLNDYTEHRITEFYGFTWDENLIMCNARVYCAACEEEITVPAETRIHTSYAPVRVDYVASVTINGEVFTSEVKSYVGVKIQDMIGMTNKVVDFDGMGVTPEEVLDNHRLVDSPSALKEYEAYFLDENGNKLTAVIGYDNYAQPIYGPDSVYLPGSYDLLVVGLMGYVGQEYIYEDALTITPITVNVTVADVYKYYDGNASFTPVFTVDNDDYGYLFDVVVSDAESNEAGAYVLEMGIALYDKSYAKGMEIVFSRDTVNGYIFPRIDAVVENKNYPTEFTYGDVIPDPKAENFTFPEGSELKFEWLNAVYDNSSYSYNYTPIDSKPQNAGEYILRVTAKCAGYVDYTYELPVNVSRKQLSLKIEGGEKATDEYGGVIYYVDMYEKLDFTIEGFVNGDSAESLGAIVTYYQDSYSLPEINDEYLFPYQPNHSDYYGEGYSLRVYGEFKDLLSGQNYEKAYESIYVIVKAPEHPTPVFGDDDLEDGEKQEIGVVYSWEHPVSLREDTGITLYGTVMKDGELFDSFEIYGEDGESVKLWNVLNVTDAGEYSVTVVARYAYEDDYVEGYNVNISFRVDFANEYGESLDSITEIGRYTVKVTDATETARETNITVRREISMQIKPFDFEISAGYPEFDIRNFTMEAGKVVLIGHTIVDVEYEFYLDWGNISVKSIKVVDGEGRDVSDLYKVTPYQSVDIHVFDSPCDAVCNHGTCDYVRDAKHTGGVATCSSLAVCENCGNEYGSYELHRHTSDETVFSPDFADKMAHNLLYTCCGAVKTSAGHRVLVAATCTTLAICADCGWGYGEFDPHNHSSSEMSYSPDASDPTLHKATHVCCKASFTEAHEGGEATCKDKAKCEKCGASYGEIDPDNHKDITCESKDNDTHSAKCNHCEVTWEEAHSGGVATCKTLAKCEGCGSSYGSLDADNHESEEKHYAIREENPSMHDYLHSCCNGFISKAYHSGGEANCASAALCDYCGTEYGNKNPDLHKTDEIAYKQNPLDAASHIKLHACCGVEIATEAHTGAGTADCYHGDICDICGIEYSEKLGHVYDDAADTQCNVCGKEVASQVIDSVIIQGGEQSGDTNEDTNGESDEDSDGCGSSVEFAPAMLIAILSLVGFATLKKKKD